jgi:hypothetical protein
VWRSRPSRDASCNFQHRFNRAVGESVGRSRFERAQFWHPVRLSPPSLDAWPSRTAEASHARSFPAPDYHNRFRSP